MNAFHHHHHTHTQATFEAGLNGLLQLAESGAAAPAALVPAAQRVAALLKARYSNPAWLRLGARLFSALQRSNGALGQSERAKLDGYQSDIRTLLGDEEGEEGASSAQAREQTLGEMLGFVTQQVSSRLKGWLWSALKTQRQYTSRCS